jgi:hypothetical protein
MTIARDAVKVLISSMPQLDVDRQDVAASGVASTAAVSRDREAAIPLRVIAEAAPKQPELASVALVSAHAQNDAKHLVAGFVGFIGKQKIRINVAFAHNGDGEWHAMGKPPNLSMGGLLNATTQVGNWAVDNGLTAPRPQRVRQARWAPKAASY